MFSPLRAEDLLSYDQINVKKLGPVVDSKSVLVVPGSSGFQLTFKPSDMLEGFRPRRIVRMFPDGWLVEALPREEEMPR
jgi:hypothetical protein